MEGKESGGGFVLVSLRADCAQQELPRSPLQNGMFVAGSFFFKLFKQKEKKINRTETWSGTFGPCKRS